MAGNVKGNGAPGKVARCQKRSCKGVHTEGEKVSDYPWFKMYSTFIHRHKVRRLSHEHQLVYVKLMCLHNAGNYMDATIPELARDLDLSEKDTRKAIRTLKTRKFLEQDGSIHDWDDHQARSAVSTKRVRKHRERKKRSKSGTLHGNVPGTFPKKERKKETRRRYTPDGFPVREDGES
jgi:hypothetical protein